MFKKIISSVLIVTLLSLTSGIFSPIVANAASISTARAIFGRLKAAAPSDSLVVYFVTPTGLQTSGDTITLTFSSQFVLAATAAANFDIGMGNSGVCTSASYTDETVSLSPSATDWGVNVTGQVMTFSPKTTGGTLNAGYCVRIEMGTAAVTGGTGAANTVTNGAADDNDNIAIAGGFGDTGTITVDIMDDDQVSITANVNQSLTFDLDAGTSVGETGAPYNVPLGVLSSGTVTHSSVGGINQIFADGGTNASGGMNVTVRNANGANGLVSTSVPSDKIPSASAAMAAGTANYGLCVDSATVSGFARSSTYNTTCTLASGTNAVVGLTSSAADILTSVAPVASGHAQIMVNAAISTATPAHTDYTDTLTFVATASF